MNIKLQTNEQLSATVANGLAGVFVNGVSLSASLSSVGGKVYFDNRISGVTGSDDLSVVRLSADEYAQMLEDGECLSNAVYIVEAPNIDALKQQIKNVAPGVELSDAVNVEQLSSITDNIEDKIRYSLISASASTSGTTQTVELVDRANNSAIQESGMTTVALAFPTATSGKARDFILAITCGSTPPNVVFPAGVAIVVDDYTDLTAEEGLNLYSFTEISADTFVVSRLLVTAYSAQ